MKITSLTVIALAASLTTATVAASPPTVAARVAATASSASTPQAPDSYTIRSKHYEIASNLTRDELRDFATHMDAVFTAFDSMFSSFRTKNAKRVRLFLWADREDYIAHGLTLGVNLSASGGVFFRRGGEAGLSTWVRDRPINSVHEVLQHEGLHQFAHLRFGDTLPLWVNEGLAVYFQEAPLVRGKLMNGVVPRHRVEEIRAGVESGLAFGFDEIIGITSQQWWNVMNQQPHRASIMYTQSWSLIHFLIHADGGKYRRLFENYLRRISQGWEHDAAFRDAFGTDDKTAFERRWRKYVLESLEPDPVTEAIERANFLAQGLRHLHEAGAPVDSLEDLKDGLRERNFAVVRDIDGVERRTEPTDEMFEAPTPERPSRNPRNQPRIELMEPDQNSGLPHGLRIHGLRVGVEVVWEHDDEAGLRYDVRLR